MRDIVQHLIQRQRLSVVEDGLRECKDREQRGRNIPVRTKRWYGWVLADFVERSRVKRADAPQFAENLTACIDDAGAGRRRKSEATRQTTGSLPQFALPVGTDVS